MKMDIKVEITDVEVRDYLTRKGYMIEQHDIPSSMGIFGTSFDVVNTMELALCYSDTEITKDNEYQKVFNRLIEGRKNKVKEYLLS